MKNLFSCLFGWRNGGVSNWKRLIKSIQGRVKVLNNKRESVIRQSTNDVVQLLMNSNEHQRALVRVDLLSKDQNIVAAYNLLDQFCDIILSNLPYILQHMDYPSDINEALSSLLYASARCGDLPELMELRKLFGRRYGENFVRGAVELLPGNFVNPQMIEKLSVKSISHDVKFRLMKQIAIDNGLELGPPDIDCKVELQQDKVYDLSLSLNSNQINSAAKVEEPKELDHQYAPEIILHRFSSQSYPEVSSSSRASSSVSIDQQKVERITEPASENSFQLSERNIVHHNDVEEFKVHPGVQKDSTKDKDQRLLMFKSTSTQTQGGDNRASLSDLNECDHLYTDDRRMKTCEKSVGKTSSWNTSKKRKSTRRRLNRRCNQIEHQMCSGSTSMSFSIKDMESDIYYKKELNRRPVSSKTIHRKKLTSTEQLYCEQRKQKEERYSEDSLPQGSKSNFNCDVEDNCCLESPCYFVTSEDRNDSDCPTPRSSVSHPHTPKIRREVYKKEIESCASSSGSHSKKMSPLTTQTRPHPTHLRKSMTMPPRERPKDVVLSDQILRSASCEFLHSNGSSSSPCRHIHPKLPDCDELATMFKAFKEEYIESVIEEFSEFSKEEYIQSVIEEFSKEFVCN